MEEVDELEDNRVFYIWATRKGKEIIARIIKNKMVCIGYFGGSKSGQIQIAGYITKISSSKRMVKTHKSVGIFDSKNHP